MTAEHFILGDRVRSIDGRYEGIVFDRDSYGWPIVEVPLPGGRTGLSVRELYEAPGYWRVIR